MNKEKRYYVYEWYDLDTNEVFYIGKGTRGRAGVINGRSKAFIKYYNEHNCAYHIVKNGLNEEDAYKLEKESIANCKSNVLCNLDEGGRKLGVFKGKDNPMYGISPKERMDEETYKIWYEKHTDICGEKNPNYGKHTLKGIKRDEEWLDKHRGSKNGRAKTILMKTPDGKLIKEFQCKKDCSQYLIDNGIDTGDLDNIRHRINWAISKDKLYKGYSFEEK